MLRVKQAYGKMAKMNMVTMTQYLKYILAKTILQLILLLNPVDETF